MATATRYMGMISVNKNSNYLSCINQSPWVQKSQIHTYDCGDIQLRLCGNRCYQRYAAK